MQVLLNVFLSATLISTVLWIAKTNPVLGGFILSLPLSTLIALAFSQLQTGDAGNTSLLAKSIFIGVPSTLLFFVPFLFAERMKLGFWTAYASGFALLIVSYFVHRFVMQAWLK